MNWKSADAEIRRRNPNAAGTRIEARLGPTFVIVHGARDHSRALAGGPPRRPGLVRDENGASIALGVWALPRSVFGDFMAAKPPPLCIGSVTLCSGESVKGFLSESAGLDGAREITHLGGWRGYLEARVA